jgi:hypothetical protein
MDRSSKTENPWRRSRPGGARFCAHPFMRARRSPTLRSPPIG